MGRETQRESGTHAPFPYAFEVALAVALFALLALIWTLRPKPLARRLLAPLSG